MSVVDDPSRVAPSKACGSSTFDVSVAIAHVRHDKPLL